MPLFASLCVWAAVSILGPFRPPSLSPEGGDLPPIPLVAPAEQELPAVGTQSDTIPAAALTTRRPDLSLDRQRLRQALDHVMRRHALQKARVGMFVQSLETGDVIYQHDAQALLNPASNVKLFTAATALARLGPEFKFATDFGCDARITHGECGVLYIKGRGDPTLTTERIYGIVGELMHRGLRKVGDIVIDDSYFDSEREGPGWDQERGDRPYLAPAGAMSVNHNSVGVFVSPGDGGDKGKARVEVEPPSDYFRVDNRVSMAPRGARMRLVPQSIPAVDHQRIIVTGRLPVDRPTAVFYRRVNQPPLYAGETFRQIMRERGIVATGKVRAGVLPDHAHVFYTARSAALAEVVRELNKVSNNFVAEQLLKATGAEVLGVPGTWNKGVQAVEAFLEELGVPRGSYIMKNGSGLNDTNRFSAAQVVRLLAAVHLRGLFYPEYISSLSIAGRDGTIRSRMEGTPAEGRLRGKTGTLHNVTALSGYVALGRNETLAFSIIVNDFAGQHGPAVSAVDALAAALASGGNFDASGANSQLAESMTPPEELLSRVATFSQLGQLADRRNLPFLRSTLRAERDPVLRAVVADAIFRSDPDGSGNVLLDNVPRSPQVFLKLRTLGKQLDITTPLIGSLLDVAADGNEEALDRVIEVAGVAKGDAETVSVLADGFEEIGRTAPGELLEALSRADETATDSAVQFLATGIAETTEKVSHPFMDRLRQAQAQRHPLAPQVLDTILKAIETAPPAAAAAAKK